MKKILLTIMLLFAPFIINAYEIKEDWNKILGGEYTEHFMDIVQTSDGGYVVVGYSDSQKIEDIEISEGLYEGIIIKYDRNGSMQWYQIYEVPNTGVELLSVMEDSNENIIIGGGIVTNYELNLTGGSIILKYNSNGDKIWERKIENTFSRVRDIIENSLGNYIVIGHVEVPEKTYSDTNGYIYEYTPSGEVVRNTEFGGRYSEYFMEIVQVEDEGYVVVGDVYSDDIPNFEITSLEGLIMKYDKNLEIVWMKHWGGTSYDSFDSLTKTPDGGYLVVAVPGNNTIEGIDISNTSDTVLVKFDKNGNVVQQKQVPYNLLNIKSTKNGKYIGVGALSEYNTAAQNVVGYSEAAVVVIDKDFNIEWQEIYRGDSDESFKAASITKNGFIAVGETTSSEFMDIITNGYEDGLILTYSYEFEININESEQGETIAEQIDDIARIEVKAKDGFELDQIVAKDNNENILDIKKIENNIYSFNIYDDVNIEVTYKEAIVNPKTGILDVMTIIIIGFIMSLTGFFIVKTYNERLEM